MVVPGLVVRRAVIRRAVIHRGHRARGGVGLGVITMSPVREGMAALRVPQASILAP